LGEIDFTHPAPADLAQNFVRANPLPDHQLDFILWEKSRDLKGGGFQEARLLLVRGNQSFDLLLQRRIASTGLFQEGSPLARFPLKGSFKQFLKLAKTFGSHQQFPVFG
jgi:hypothetical protein